MKALRTLLLLATLSVLLSTCNKTDGLLADGLGEDTEITPRSSDKMVTVPFKVRYLGNYTSIGYAERCGEFPHFVNVIVDGEGTGTHVGRSTVHFDFCVDNSDGTYGDATAYIVAANGDILYVSVEGQVMQGRLDDHPEYVTSYWKDPFVILGGTGRFEGASGSGMTDDYNSSEDSYSHHDWTGTITMKK